MSASLQRNVPKLMGRNFIMQQENDPEHTANITNYFIREKKWKWPSQSPDFIPIEHAFHLQKKRLTNHNKPGKASQKKNATVW